MKLPQLTPKTPYLLRAMHQWLEDNAFTPYLMIDVNAPNVVAPKEYAQDGKLVLAISYNATGDLVIGDDGLSFKARFGGVPRDIWIPMNAVLAIYAKEDPMHGMPFDPNEYKDFNPEPKKKGLKLVK